MLRSILTLTLFGCLLCLVVYPVSAAMEATGNTASINSGENVLAGAVFNDSAGSSDLSLIIQLKADDEILVDEGSPCKALEPKKNIPSDADPTGWTLPGFNDSSWPDGKYGVGYADNDDNTVIGSKADNTISIYSRALFNVADPLAITKLSVGVDYDDAAVIWINGVEVVRTPGPDIPEKPEWNSWTDKGSGHSHEASKQKPPRYSVVTLPVKVISNPFAVNPTEKLAATWSKIKNSR